MIWHQIKSIDSFVRDDFCGKLLQKLHFFIIAKKKSWCKVHFNGHISLQAIF